jgi:3-deoxy-D-manno-octulosonic-acid transferase
LLLILAPRKPERFDVVAENLTRAGVTFVRRTALAPVSLPGVSCSTLLANSLALFESADVVFMGGTLAMRGATIS